MFDRVSQGVTWLIVAALFTIHVQLALNIGTSVGTAHFVVRNMRLLIDQIKVLIDIGIIADNLAERACLTA